MRQGLIAQWHRGIAARGLVGAMLLMIPVLVGATIGFGGVSAGLTSLASGPSATAVGTTGSKTAGDQPGGQDIERLSASLTTTLAQQRVTLKHPGGTGGPKSSSSAPGTTAVGGGTESDSSSDSSSGGGGSPAASGSGGGSTVTPPSSGTGSSPPVTSGATNIVTDILNNLLNPPK
jgi:hypothetical protein